MSGLTHKCFLCLTDCGEEEDFVQHVQSHLEGLQITGRHCLFCRLKIDNMEHYHEHMSSHLLQCRRIDCQHYSLEKSELKAHEKSHLPITMYSCSKCKHIFTSVEDRNGHFVDCHTTRNICRGCGLPYTSATIDTHERQCPSVITNPSVLISHGDIIVHPLIGYHCFLCPFKGDTLNELKRHFQCHLGMLDTGSSLDRIDLITSQIVKEPMASECPHHGCGVRFCTRAEAYSHMKESHKNFGFDCIFSFCPFVSDDKGLLRKHEEEHKVLHKCDICDHCPSSLEQHMLLKHLKRNLCRVCNTVYSRIEIHENKCLTLQKELLGVHPSLIKSPSLAHKSMLPKPLVDYGSTDEESSQDESD